MNGPSKAAGIFALLIDISAKYFRHLNGCGRSLGVTDNGVNVHRGAGLGFSKVARIKALQKLRILKSIRYYMKIAKRPLQKP
jgi:hypothetical protein